MLRKTRISIAAIVFAMLTLLFLDFTGTLHSWFGWLARLQLVPALLAGSVAIVTVLLAITFFFGRVYCSAICPLGVVQDCVSNLSGRLGKKKPRFGFSKAKKWLRHGVLAIFVIELLAHGNHIVSLLDPYSGFGRIASNLIAPVYRAGNNILAGFAEAVDSFVFFKTDIWTGSGATFRIAAITLVVIVLLAWRHGRTYCNAICPVGTFLGFISRFSVYRPTFVVDKCTRCGQCERACKASCIDSANMDIDHSRCVACFNCIKTCNFNAMEYACALPKMKAPTGRELAESNGGAMTRRGVISIGWTLLAAKTAKAQQQVKLFAEGSLADILDKQTPERKVPIVPPGAMGPKNLQKHCTACQLCVSSCPNKVLLPSSRLATLMQPEMSFERGFCRPECTECSQVCPTGAIKKMTPAKKTAISIGSAIWIKDNCIVNRDKVQCISCERYCPTEAITLVDIQPAVAVVPPGGQGPPVNLKIPAIDNEKCTGCGACEYYCPARPFAAIFLEGHHMHHKRDLLGLSQHSPQN